MGWFRWVLAISICSMQPMLKVVPDKERTGKQAFPCVLPGKVGSFLEGSRDEFADFSAQKACG